MGGRDCWDVHTPGWCITCVLAFEGHLWGEGPAHHAAGAAELQLCGLGNPVWLLHRLRLGRLCGSVRGARIAVGVRAEALGCIAADPACRAIYVSGVAPGCRCQLVQFFCSVLGDCGSLTANSCSHGALDTTAVILHAGPQATVFEAWRSVICLGQTIICTLGRGVVAV